MNSPDTPEIPLAFGMMNEAKFLDTVVIDSIQDYRHAVRICYAHRRIHGMTKQLLAALAGLYASHVTDYLSEKPGKRSLPAEKIAEFESICGNHAITQWWASQKRFTLMERVIDKQQQKRVA